MPGAALAQRGTIIATVGDATTETYVPRVTVTLVELGWSLETDIVGQVRFARVPSGTYTVRTRRLGYPALSAPIKFDGRDSLQIRLMLEPAAQTLRTVTVRDSAVAPWLSEFERRRRTGNGRFITSADIRTSLGTDMATILSVKIPGIRAVRNPAGTTEVFSTRGANGLGGTCQVEVFLDGTRLQNGDAAELPLELIGGIEYHTPATVPVRYKTIRAGNARRRGVVEGGIRCLRHVADV